MVVGDLEIDRELMGLRREAHYWQAMHARVCERERFWKEKAEQLDATVRQQAAEIIKINEEKENLKARVLWLQQQLFGRKSQKGKPEPEPSAPDDPEADPSPSGSPDDHPEKKRKRGKRPGTKGYGRKRYEELFTVEIIHDLPEGEKQCPCCGRAFLEFPGTEDSQEIHWEVHLVRRIHRRKRYLPTCSCDTLPGIVTAPCPPKLIPKGLFSIGFWVRLLLEKFLFQRPLFRIRKTLELEGLFVSQGTLTGGLTRLGELLQPLYTKILERSRAAKHWHMDETRWMVFVEVAGKVGHRWWLWVVITEDTCAYLLDPSRSADVPRNHLGEDAEGIINADRYSAYKVLEKEGHFRIAFCWFHVRQDFVRIHNEYRRLRAWAEGWLKRINDLFERNDRRLQFPQSSEQFRHEDLELRKALEQMLETCKSELADAKLHRAAKKALVSLQNHWGGLTLFVDHPEIPMDNNESERRLRNPVVGRKNYYGSGSIWSGTLAAMLFTLFQTLLLNHIDPQKHLVAYFEACARNGGEPPKDLEAFLPWNLSEERKAAWKYPSERNTTAPEDKPP
jgi:transposase